MSCLLILFVLGFALFDGITSLQAAPSVSASLDRRTVPAGESVNLTLTFHDAEPDSAPTLPTIPRLRYGGVSQSTHVQISNGRMVKQNKFIYSLVALQKGRVTIPPITAKVSGRLLRTSPLILTITDRATPNTNQPESAFLRLNVNRREFYVGEAFPLEIHLYWQNGQDIRTPQVKAEGFSVSQNPIHHQTRTRVGNYAYNLLVFKMAASAARTGNLVLGPAECDMSLLIPVQRNRRDPFDFFGSRMTKRPVTLTTKTLPVKVLPLPDQNVPETFNGAVGRYSMTVTVSPTNVAVGDPITIQARISGSGQIEGINLPTQTEWRDFKVYPPNASTQLRDELGLQGSKTFEQVVIPENHELTVLPSLQFSFFDPRLKTYRTLSNAPVRLTVRHASQAASPLPALTNANNQANVPQDDIIHIRAQAAGVTEGMRPWVSRPWFLGIQGIPVAAWLALLLLRKQRDSLARNPKLQRQKATARRVQSGLKELHDLVQQGQAEAFYAGMFRVIQEQMGERLDLPASAITEAVIDDRLAEKGLSEEKRAVLHKLFQACNEARYAPDLAAGNMAELLGLLESTLEDLRKIKA